LPRAGAIACPAEPLGGCLTGASQVSTLVLRDARDSRDDRLHWKLARGAATELEFFGNPINGSTTVLLCLYDAAGTPQPVMSAVAPPAGTCDAKPCWRLRESRGYRYRSRADSGDGVVRLKLRRSRAGEAQVLVKGRGARLRLPGLPLSLPVLAQLLVGDANATTCWAAEFDRASRNDGAQFRASSP